MPASKSAAPWSKVCRSADISGAQYALLLGDARVRLADLPKGSIHTCLTSPPYWSARDYEHPSQIGQEETVDEYVDHLVEVFRGVRRALRDDGTAWLNLGDAYLGGVGTVNGKPPAKGWKRNKQLALVPFRVAMALQEDGWWIRNAAVWHKPNAMPASVRDRLTNTWEPVFLLSKSERYFFDLDRVRVPHTTDDANERRRAQNGSSNGKAKGQAQLRRWLNSPRHRSTIDGLKTVTRRPNAPRAVELAVYLREALEDQGRSIRWVAQQLDLPFERTRHYFRTDEIGSRLPPHETWLRLKELLRLDDRYDEAMAVEVGDNIFRNHPRGRNPGDMLSVAVRGTDHPHFATMPRPLAEFCLRATLPRGGRCLDPFMGVGTTGHVAVGLGGRFVGVDVHESYLELFRAEHETANRNGHDGSRNRGGHRSSAARNGASA